MSGFAMYVTYFDEVKAMPANGQNSYFVGGICVPMANVREIEQEVVLYAQHLFKSSELSPETKFHASDIYWGKGNFAGIEATKRIETIVKLAEIIAKAPIKRVFAEVVTDRLKFGVDPAETAFMFFCERVQLLMAAQKSHSILIGDQDDEQMKDMIKRFNTYRLTGTFWDYGIEIESVVDSVYFARSHYSRMLQLADAYIFIISHKFTKSRNGWMAEKLREELKDKIQPVMHKYKSWPSPNVDF